MRLDKYLADAGIGTRSEVKNYIRGGKVTVDGLIIKDPGVHVSDSNVVCLNGVNVCYEEFVYYMLNKPAGVVSATKDAHDRTVLDLLSGENIKNVSMVGRLDKDTEGLLLLTNDGALSHTLLSPTHHVAKKYLVYIAHPLSEDEIKKIEAGLSIGNGEVSRPAIFEYADDGDDTHVYLTITEGKFHEVKRIFEAVQNRVLYLKRISMGSLVLDDTLALGSYRRLTENEIKALKGE